MLNDRPMLMFDDGTVIASLVGPMFCRSTAVDGVLGSVVRAMISAVRFDDIPNRSGDFAKLDAFIGTTAVCAGSPIGCTV